MREFRIAIVGAGLGGLALAQGLKRGEVAFDVFEADRSLNSRPQGYRIRIDAQGQRALAQTLPPELYELFRATVSTSIASVRFVTPNLDRSLGRVPESWHRDGLSAESDKVAQDVSVDRRTLREILMSGIEDRVQFNRSLERYAATNDGRVELSFGQGVPVTSCDLLIGADGVNSRVRSELAPHAEPTDTGTLCFYGKTDLDRLDRNAADYEGTNIVLADGFAAILEQMQFDRPHCSDQRSVSGRKLSFPNDYLYWCLIGPYARFDLEANARVDSERMRRAILSVTSGWHPSLRQILQQSEVADMAMLPIRSGRPDVLWPAGPVTLLGDAIHAMTPAGGLGANTALADAAALADAILKASHGTSSLRAGLEKYESEMRRRAVLAVGVSNDGALRLFD